MTTISKLTPYRVLARKYRPQKLSELVGQDVLVKTLTQGITQNRLPHAFLLHGIRGVGKTTTARIIAKALNCLGPDGQGQPTPDPCGVCPSCVSIMDDRHLDVVEMDAASRTSVEDVRELIEAARYKAVNARYKVYIIDEVHMLSKSAFNALLKTLEEPPPHVIFVFATTEIRKVPDTVLSRCMRFDLNRIDPATMIAYFRQIADRESITIDDEALALIVRAADGSARDGLSLLDQAIALAEGQVTSIAVREMLGLVERGQVYTILEYIMAGDVSQALEAIRSILSHGGDSVVVIQDLLDLVYWLTCLKISPALHTDPTWPESERGQGIALANRLPLPALMQAWQVLHRGYEEIMRSPLPAQALEMVVIRLAYLKELPSIDELVAFAKGNQPSSIPQSRSVMSEPVTMAVTRATIGTPQAQIAVEPMKPQPPSDFRDLVNLVQDAREPILYTQLLHNVHLIAYNPDGCSITMRIAEGAPKNLVSQLRDVLEKITGRQWTIDIAQEGGQPTFAEQKHEIEERQAQGSKDHPLVKSLTEAFPGAKVVINKK